MSHQKVRSNLFETNLTSNLTQLKCILRQNESTRAETYVANGRPTTI